ncbi:MAG: hypothetical protein IT262_17790 [Saprospiraceae bacterium]|nr:hypothetical protein [Saprospiraceae bacterium]
MFRKIAGILLLLCLVAPVLVTYSRLQCQKAAVKKEVKRRMIAGLDKSELVLLKFSRAAAQTELHWEHAKEFEFEGRMYDVVETALIGDTLYYHCWWDHEETQLNRQLKNLVAGVLKNDAERRENQQHLLHFYKSLYYLTTPVQREPASVDQNRQCSFYTFSHLSLSYLPLTPPPEAC